MTANKLSIDATEKTSTTAATAPGVTDTALADDAEITTSQPQSAIFATGRYQVIPVTMKDHLLETGLTTEDLYDEVNQDRFCMTLIYGTKRPILRDYLLGVDGVTLNRAQTNFAQEWSSVPTPAGESYYGGESSHHTTQETRNLLERVRKANRQMESSN
jgi:hypothetical protein